MKVTDINRELVNEVDIIAVATLNHRSATLKVGTIDEITPGGNIKYIRKGYNYSTICKTGQFLKLS